MNYTHLDTTHPTARKRHICDCCLCYIDPGAQYTLHKGVCDGEFQRDKLCSDCESINDGLWAYWADDDGDLPEMMEYYYEHLWDTDRLQGPRRKR